MKKILLEIFISAIFVAGLTIFFYFKLESFASFWNAQNIWSAILALCWVIVAIGYYHQGWLVRSKKNAEDVSLILPIAVFVVQCVLFIKGIYYNDWSLIAGAVMVNSGVVFNISQILKVRHLM